MTDQTELSIGDGGEQAETKHVLIQLTAENIKRVRSVSFALSPAGLTVIAGENDEGKSSVLDALMFLFLGRKHPDPKLLRTGAKKGFVEAETEEIIIKRTITEGGGGSLIIRPKGGRKGSFGSPQAFLDSITKRVCFDPMEIMRMAPKKQAEELRILLGLDFAETDKRIAEIFEQRTEMNRKLKEATALVDTWEFDASAKEKKDPAPLRERLDQVGVLTRKADYAKEELNEAKNTLVRYRERLSSLELRKKTLLSDLEEVQTAINNGTKATEEKVVASVALEKQCAEAVAAVPDTSALMKELEAINAHNTNVENTESRADKAKERDGLRRESERMTREIEGLTEDKAKKIAATKFPVAGLSFDLESGILLYRDEPLQQAASAHQLKVCTAISAAMNPKMPAMILRDGSLLSKKSMADFASFTRELGIQILMERVERDEFVSVEIVDGQIAPDTDGSHGTTDQGKTSRKP